MFEARDKASEIISKINEGLTKFSGAADRAAETATAAGAKIDDSLLKTASGADALELATARVEGAEAKLTAATDEQAAAERNLMEIRSTGTATADELSAATDRLGVAEKNTQKATSDLNAAQKLQKDTAAAAAAATDKAAASTAKAGDAAASSAAKNEKSAGGLTGVGKAAGLLSVGLLAAGGYMVKAAGDFQSSTAHLVTDAGESQKNLGMVQAGMLNIAKATGTTTDQLSAGMYHIESAGFHGKAGLDMLTTAAEGAKVGGADLDTVSKTLTGTLNSYSTAGYTSTQMMNALISTVGAGDMKMEDLASSLGNVTPLAAAAGLSYAQVGGAIATMTAQNMSAQQATQDLNNTIRNLQKPTDVAAKQMASLGINSGDVTAQLGKRGLTGTLDMLTTAVAAHTKGGQVLIDTYRASTTAASDAQAMLNKLPPSMEKLGQAYLKGSVSAKDWKADLQGLDPINAHLMSQFGSVADKTHQFNDLLAKGGPAATSFSGAMGNMLGGATGLNTALMLTGGRMQTFKDNVNTVQDALSKGSKTVDNWSTIQGTFNQKLEVAKATAEATGISLGNALLPMVSQLATDIGDILTPIADWVSQHTQLTAQLLLGAAAIGALVAGVTIAKKIFDTFRTILHAAQKALELFATKETETAAVSEESAGRSAAAWVGAGAKMVGQALVSAAKFTAEMVAQAAQVAAQAVASAASTAASWVASGAVMVAKGLQQAAVWVGGMLMRFTMVSAAAISEAAMTAAAWIAANAAMLLAGGGIVLALGLIVAGILYLATHWHQAWEAIKAGAIAAWHWLDTEVIQPIVAGFEWLYHSGILPVVDGIRSAWHTIEDDAFAAWSWLDTNVIQPLENAWNSMWSGMGNFASSMWNWINNNVIQPLGSAFSWVTNTLSNIGSSISNIGSHISGLLGFDEGGTVPGAAGRPMLAVVHGGEYVLSRDMLAGRVSPDVSMMGRLGGTSGFSLAPTMSGAGGTTNQVNIIVQGNQVINDQAAKQLANRIGRVVATQILPSAGVRIRS